MTTARHQKGDEIASSSSAAVTKKGTSLSTRGRGPSEQAETSRQARWRARNPQAAWAHSALRSAIKRGLVVRQPCIVCGEVETDAHHEDYRQPLDVPWLCRKHHREAHKRAARP